MFNPQQVLDLLNKASVENWPYPLAVTALKDHHVLWYDCDVATDTLVYHGADDKSVQGASPTISSPLPIAEQFDEAKLKDAIAIRLAKDISRLDFLTLIAAAGVASYKSDMLARTITFKGFHSGSYVLHIPQM